MTHSDSQKADVHRGRLLYFYPENDSALAADLANYTAPEAAQHLRLAGEALPLWYDGAGDRVLLSGINGAWYDRMVADFGITADVFDYDCQGLTPEPWGWSRAVRSIYAAQGMPAEKMPSDADLERIRTLSSRLTSIDLSRHLLAACPLMATTRARAVTDEADLARELERRGSAIVKQPWSSSGRGVMDTRTLPAGQALRRAAGIIRRQGAVVVEDILSRTADFALLFRADAGRVSFSGVSLFNVNARYGYEGNLVGQQQTLRRILIHYISETQTADMVEALQGILADMIGDAYTGPLGVDMMATADGPAVAELNLRNTMGHVCLTLGERLLEPDVLADYRVAPLAGAFTEPEYACRNGRLTAGTLSLTPRPRFFSFLLSVRPDRL